MKHFRQKTITILIGLFLSTMAYGSEGENSNEPQTPENHQISKRVHVDASGKIFAWDNVKFYLRISTSPEEEGTILLGKKRTGSVEEEATPLEMKGHGKHTITSQKKGKSSNRVSAGSGFPIYVDGKPPLVNASVSKAPSKQQDNVTVYGKPVQVSLNFEDRDSGIHSRYFAMGEEQPLPYEAPIELNDEGDYLLKFYAFDNVGNKSAVVNKRYALDFTPPATEYKFLGHHVGTIVSYKSRIKLVSSDSRAGVKTILYRLKGNRSTYRSSLSLRDLQEGEHTITYSAIDHVGNAEENKDQTFYVDRTPPTVSYSIQGEDTYKRGNKTYISGRSRFALSATDDKAGVAGIRYYLKLGKGEIYNKPFALPNRNGHAHFTYTATDKVDNTGPIVRQDFIVDVTPPKMWMSTKGERFFSRITHYIRKDTKISFHKKDNLSGIKRFSYTLDKGDELEYTGSFTIEDEGEHEIITTTVDRVNNVKTHLLQFNVDETKPELFPRFSVSPTENEEEGQPEIYPLHTKLYLAATDQQSGIRSIRYRINGGQTKNYKSALAFTKLGQHKVNISATDNVGNVSKQQLEFIIQK